MSKHAATATEPRNHPPSARIAVLGCGNMGHTLLQGLVSGGCPPDLLRGADPSAARRAQLKDLKIPGYATAGEAIAGADAVLVAVKPGQVPGLLREIRNTLPPGALLLSIAAGIRLRTLQAALPPDTPIVRAMPNTPALIGAGITGLCATARLDPRLRRRAEAILRSVGSTLWIEPEQLMDTVTALSGSGPAYFFYFLECLETAAVELGLPTEQARLLARHTALGAAQMSFSGNSSAAPVDLAGLRRAVTSPGGTTEAALREFQDAGLEDITRRALRAAQRRADSLSEPSE